jgi:hypothetical protein
LKEDISGARTDVIFFRKLSEFREHLANYEKVIHGDELPLLEQATDAEEAISRMTREEEEINFLLAFTEFSSSAKVNSKQSHNTVDDLSVVSRVVQRNGTKLTSNLKSLSSAKRSEHSLMSSICRDIIEPEIKDD